MSNTNGTAAPPQTVKEFTQILANVNGVLSQRLRAAGQGYQYQTERDLYDTLGYKRELGPQDYINKFRRGSIAGRGVALHAEDTWKRKAILIDGEARSDQQQPASEFLKAWNILANKHQLWNRFKRVDILGRLGQYAVLWLGVREAGEVSPKTELTKKLTGPDDLLYVRPYFESNAAIDEMGQDTGDPRFGKPLIYKITTGDKNNSTKEVHWSRVLHVAEDLLEDDVYGMPALESVYNRLDDLEKVVGGSSEAFWLNIRKGMAILAREGVDLPTESAAKTAFNDEIEKYIHNLSRVMRLQGVDIEDLGADIIDGLRQFTMLVSVIAADLDIPQRKLIGNEQGERASSQDERNWAAKIASRQTDYAEPMILRAFIDWCIKHGVLPKPANGYTVEWPPVYEPTEQEQAETARTVAEALDIFSVGLADHVMETDHFTEKYLNYVRPETIEDMIADEEGVGSRE